MGTTAEKLQKLMQTKDDIKTAINDPALGDKFADYPTAITDGKLYKCLSDTNFSPEEYPQAWEKQRG